MSFKDNHLNWTMDSSMFISGRFRVLPSNVLQYHVDHKWGEIDFNAFTKVEKRLESMPANFGGETFYLQGATPSEAFDAYDSMETDVKQKAQAMYDWFQVCRVYGYSGTPKPDVQPKYESKHPTQEQIDFGYYHMMHINPQTKMY